MLRRRRNSLPEKFLLGLLVEISEAEVMNRLARMTLRLQSSILAIPLLLRKEKLLVVVAGNVVVAAVVIVVVVTDTTIGAELSPLLCLDGKKAVADEFSFRFAPVDAGAGFHGRERGDEGE